MKSSLRLMRYAWPHRRGLVAVCLTLALAIGLEVLRPWPMKLLVDNILGAQPWPEPLKLALARIPGGEDALTLLWIVCVGTVVLFLAHGLMAMIYTRIAVTFGQRMVYDLGADVFLHLQRLSLLFHSRRPVGDTVGRVTGDAYCVQTLVSNAFLPLLQSVLTLAAMFVIMWQLQPTMSLLMLGVVPFMAFLIYCFGGPMKDRNREQRDLEGHMMSIVEQTLTAIPAVQAFTREELEHERFRRCADDTVAAYRRSVTVDMWFKLLVGLVTSVGMATIIYVGGIFAFEGKVTVGTILLFLAYLASLYEPLNSVVYTASVVQHAAASADRIVELLDIPHEIADAPDALEIRLHGHVRYEDVIFGYQSGRPVLNGISLEARPGEVLAIVGPTGAGKTTLVNLLLRFFDPWSGRITVDGHDLRRLRVRSLRQQVAMVLQEPFIFPLSVVENLVYGKPEATRDEMAAAASAANADEFIRRLPHGYDTILGERGATLSGGEKQRLAIARAFLKDAPVLILDEPTSALDAQTEKQLLEALERLMVGRTTIIIAHRLSTIQRADRILVIADGQLRETGTHEELLARNGLYARWNHLQFDGHKRQSVMGEELSIIPTDSARIGTP